MRGKMCIHCWKNVYSLSVATVSGSKANEIHKNIKMEDGVRKKKEEKDFEKARRAENHY